MAGNRTIEQVGEGDAVSSSAKTRGGGLLYRPQTEH